MNKPNDGGPAFPTWQEWRGFSKESGMTLRDWFAGMAMQGFSSSDRWADSTFSRVARDAYFQADAMLEEREKQNEDAQRKSGAEVSK